MSTQVRAAIEFVVGCLITLRAAWGDPVASPWPEGGPDDTACVAASALCGWYAAADTFEDKIELRDVAGTLMATITRNRLQALTPWLGYTGGPDGPAGLAFTDSGRTLFILVAGAPTAPDGQPSDAVLKYDVSTDSLSIFNRLELFDRDDQWAHLAAAHFRGRLYVGASTGGVRIFNALRNATSGSLLASQALPDAGAVHGLAIDRDEGVFYAASDANIYRASVTAFPPVFTLIGSVPNIRSMAFSDQFGGAANSGLYVLGSAAGTSSVTFVPASQARGQASFAPVLYTTIAQDCHSISATADGRLLIGADEDAVMISDSSDARLGYGAWVQDEFNQQVAFAKSLVSPSAEPAGWVIDADVQQGWTRFHPATPDGACWAVLMLLAADRVNHDPQALPLVRTILTRYAGLSPDGIAPSKSPDGFMRHWIDPLTGGVKPGGWPAEFATYSTMKITAAADRAAAYFPGDGAIQRARRALVDQVRNWDAYIEANDQVDLISLPGGGPDHSARNSPFVEGILFVEQAAQYGGAYSASSFSRWINRALWPTAMYLTGKPITGDGANAYHSAFIDVYPLLLQQGYRADPTWQTNAANALESCAGWTDDNGPKYFTVFSAGTTRSDWGGYHADTLGSHAGNVTTFTALEGFCATGRTAPAVAAYHAYRRGARQTFLGGASILYRRSDVDKTYQPDSAGLPDVTMGGLGLAELLSPGTIDSVFARAYTPYTCPGDFNFDNSVNTADLTALLARFGQAVFPATPADLNTDGTINTADLVELLVRFGGSCP